MDLELCHACNNEGRQGGCPRCGRTPRKALGVKMLSFDIPTDIIPVVYQGKLWEKPEMEDKPAVYKEVDDAMETVYSMFLKGEIPGFSMFIAAPPKSGKNAFAYSCMQTALANKYEVAPYLSTGDWRRLHRISQMNPFYKLYNKYTWDDLILSDVLFLYVDHSDEHKADIPLFKSILDARASMDRSTFIMSDYKLQHLVPHWQSDLYTAIYNPDPSRDLKRYPVLLHRFT